MPQLDPEDIKKFLDALTGFLLIGLGNILWNLLTPQRSWRSFRGWLAKSWKAKQIAYLQDSLLIHAYKTKHPDRALATLILWGVLAVMSGLICLGFTLAAVLGPSPDGSLQPLAPASGMAIGATVGTCWHLFNSVARVFAPDVHREKLEAKLRRLGVEPEPTP